MNYKSVAVIEAIALIAVIGVSAFVFLTTPTTTVRISGAGATFPAPLYQNWSASFQTITGIQVDYQGIGSGAGVKQFLSKTVDFGATDPPMSTTDWNNATTQGPPGAIHIPMTIGGVVVVYNVTGITKRLNFTGSILASIFQGNITYWDDGNIASINSGVTLPHEQIVICHRSDGSGTTKIFTAFLQNENPNWKLGAGTTINWPAGSLGGTGNPGVAALVQKNQFSIGYVELQYALGASIPYGNVQNPAGYFITPSLSTLSAAVGAVTTSLPAGNQSWASVGLYLNLHFNSSNADSAYPVTAFSYIIVYSNLANVPGMTLQKANALRWFLWWATHDGQAYASALSYVPLPHNVVAIIEASIAMIHYG
nr:phosphate ABC transporter substrate-binding protein PstS [Candidatus Njordarchaeota archaeon]